MGVSRVYSPSSSFTRLGPSTSSKRTHRPWQLLSRHGGIVLFHGVKEGLPDLARADLPMESIKGQGGD